MILYLSIIAISFTLIFVINGIICLNYLQSLAFTTLSLGIVTLIDASIALLIRAIPEENIDPFGKMMIVSKSERKIWEKLGVRAFKDLIPETGKYLCNFAKDKVEDTTDNVYLLKFLRETCYAEIMHAISAFVAFVPLLFIPYKWSIYLPVALTNALLQVLPVIVQRYNRSRLTIAYRYNERKERIKYEQAHENC